MSSRLAKPPIKATTTNPGPQRDIDLSLLQKPIELGVSGALQVAKCLSGGTAEMRELLLEECDLVYECRVCRNLFRSLANFIAHKRVYCKECYSDRFINLVEDKTSRGTLLIQPEAPKERGNKSTCAQAKPPPRRKRSTDSRSSSDSKACSKVSAVNKAKQVDESDGEDTGSNKSKAETDESSSAKENGIIECVGDSAAFKFYTKVAAREKEKDEDVSCSIVELRDVKGNRNAKRQNVIMEPSDDDVKQACKRRRGPSHADLALISENIDSCRPENGKEYSWAGEKETEKEEPTGRRNLRTRGGDGGVTDPISAKLKQRKDCDVKTLTCLNCKTKYSSLKTLHFHMMSLHAEKRTFFPCLYCKATFTQMWAVNRHLQKSHRCSKEYIDKVKNLLKKRSFAKPVDELDDWTDKHNAAPSELSGFSLRLRKTARNEEHRDQVEKMEKRAADTIQMVTNKLKDKSRKREDTSFKFDSGFCLRKCLNCNKAFAKEDSLARHKAFCFGSAEEIIKHRRVLKSVASNKSSLVQVKNNVEKKIVPLETSEINEGSSTKENGNIPECYSTEPPVTTDTTEIAQSINTTAPPISIETESPEAIVKIEPNVTEGTSNERSDCNGETSNERSQCNEEEIHDTNTDFAECDTSYPVNSPMDCEESVTSSPEGINSVASQPQTGLPSEDLKTTLQKMASGRFTEIKDKDVERVRGMIDETSLECLKCSRKYGSISNLHRHAVRHLGWKRFRCTLCIFTAYNRSECKTHLTRVHLEKASSNLDRFILDLEPEKMKAGLSSLTRVERTRLSSVRILERMQQTRQQQGEEGRPRYNSTSPTSDSGCKASNFNISTRLSPRKYDIRPYYRSGNSSPSAAVSQGGASVLFTRSGSYVKPQTKLNFDDSEDEESEQETSNENDHTYGSRHVNGNGHEGPAGVPELGLASAEDPEHVGQITGQGTEESRILGTIKVEMVSDDDDDSQSDAEVVIAMQSQEEEVSMESKEKTDDDQVTDDVDVVFVTENSVQVVASQAELVEDAPAATCITPPPPLSSLSTSRDGEVQIKVENKGSDDVVEKS